MGDAVFLLVMFGFFGLSALYVLGCRRLIDREGAVSTAADVTSATDTPEMVGR